MTKKLLFASALALVLTVTFSSCTKCQVCKKSSSPEVKVCEKDYSSNTEYGLVLDGYQSQGYSCNNSL